MNPSYIVGFVIYLTDTMSMAMMMTMLQPLILLMDIPLDMIQIDLRSRRVQQRKAIRLLFKISTSH